MQSLSTQGINSQHHVDTRLIMQCIKTLNPASLFVFSPVFVQGRYKPIVC